MAKGDTPVAANEPTTDIATIVIDDPETALAALLRGEAVEASDPVLVDEAIARRILFAETEAEAFAEVTTWSTKDHVGEEFEVHDCRVLKSGITENGDRGYLVADVTDLQTGERGILTTGSTKIGAKLLWLRLHDAFPRKVRIKELGKTAKGFFPLDIETVD